MRMKTIFVILGLMFLLGCQETIDMRQNYTIPEKDLIPEGIAWSEVKGKFYLSSIHKEKIIELDAQTGIHRDFISSGAYNFPSGVGLLADDESGYLYAIASSTASQDMRSGLFIFRMSDGNLVGTYMTDTLQKHFLNDLALDKRQNVYITDTRQSKIMLLKAGSDSLEVFLEGAEVLYPNGICVSPNSRHLYIASHVHGIRIFDLETKAFVNARDTSGLSRGIDGLKYYENSLLAIQNGFSDSIKLLQLFLDEEGGRVTSRKVLAVNHSKFHIPTTGVVVRDKYYCIANSQLPLLNQEENRIKDKTKLQEVYILAFDPERGSE